MTEISQPCLPDDEHLDYIPTQVVAEYLVKEHKFKFSGEEKSVEGIIFRSAQNPNGKNIVLFGEAATVELPDVKEDSWPSRIQRKNAKLSALHDTLVTKRVRAVNVETVDEYSDFVDEDY
ncbi:RES domain-containing protein [Ruegeria sp. HKCCD7318]|nr:RES domain-containing protein [Ruegeria sp. HKCCD7318]